MHRRLQLLVKSRPDYTIEQSYLNSTVAGVDEVGRGCIAGCVVAAAVVLNPNDIPDDINDSKKLSRSMRESVAQEIKNRSLAWAVGTVDVDTIDKINILNASKVAMTRALEGLSFVPDVALIDGTHCPAAPCKAVAVKGGDAVSLSIAAASIIAKTFRDEVMRKLHDECPFYGWDRNVGYGTKEHLQLLQVNGVSRWHRRSFAPVANMLYKTS